MLHRDSEENYLLSLCCCLVISLAAVIYFYWNWRHNHNQWEHLPDSSGAKYDNYSKCDLSNCIRCQNYEQLTADLLERFLAYKMDDDGTDLSRLQTSIRRGFQIDDKIKEAPLTDKSLQNPNVFMLQGIFAKPWHDGAFLQETNILELAFPQIKQEYTKLLTQQDLLGNFDGWLENNVPNGMWSVFYLFNQGRRIQENCGRCPKTAAILDILGAFMKECAFGNAMFSVLEQGTHITEHYGPCNLRIRCHLGLHVPPNCTLTVAHESRSWHEGKCLLFDDSFLHEARHDGRVEQGPRVVLMIDFWHPKVLAEEKEALCHLFPPQ